ncbi:MAG TPA: hypothetical protein VI643_04180 [Planctomycetota bacterium]|nr:hypothetical protein [Planctomycetota bacterium]
MPTKRSFLHLHGVSRAASLDALDAVMQELGYGRDIAYVLGHLGPRDMMDFEVMVRKQPLYLISDGLEEWVAVIPAHVEGKVAAPDPSEIARLLSGLLECPALLLRVGEEKFGFQVFQLGSRLGGPTEEGALGALTPYLPNGVPRERLQEALLPESSPNELRRLVAFASLLKLDGRPEYGLADWETSKSVPWTRFYASSYFALRKK